MAGKKETPAGVEAIAGTPKTDTDPRKPNMSPPPSRVAAQPAIETIRIECLRLAMEMKTVTIPSRTVIHTAQEFEAYVTGAEPDDGEE